MLIEEAKWFSKKISSLDPLTLYPILNIGSSTETFRKTIQPWIYEYIFKPAEGKGDILCLDIKRAPGVDVVGDLSECSFLEKISKMKFKSVLCSNLLEHVTNKDEICQAIVSLIPNGGYIFVSCPYEYPFHPDPIDTLFRPNVKELANLFPNTHIISGDIVVCRNYLGYITHSPSGSPIIFAKSIVRLFLPFYKPKEWRAAVYRLPWLLRNFSATCIVLSKSYEET